MGTCLCCDKTDPGEAFVTPDQFADKLVSQVSKPSDKKGEVMINLDVIETILMDGDGTVAKADEKYVSEQEIGTCTLPDSWTIGLEGHRPGELEGFAQGQQEQQSKGHWLHHQGYDDGHPVKS